MQLSGPWTSDEVSASGQVFEFRLWALLTAQSRGLLHVFLPLADRGIDGLVHRRTDDMWISVQAKGRSTLDKGEVHLVVWADSLRDDNAMLVSGLVTYGGVGPRLLVIREGEFKRLAELSHNKDRPVYAARFSMNPTERSRFHEFLVPSERVAEAFAITLAVPAAVPVPLLARSEVGYVGEVEVIRLLAEDPELNVFRPFPDLETPELPVLHLVSRRVLGLQIKTISVDPEHPAGTVTIHLASFRPSPTTYFVCLAWLREERRFHEACLLIPSEEIRDLCRPHPTVDHLSFDWDPGSTAASQLETYRSAVSQLRVGVSRRLTCG
jgi:hypothetical protein